jgi:hypothetical protein
MNGEETPPAFGSVERSALWRSRSVGFRTAYRWNVLWALVRRDVGLRSALCALKAPHAFVALAARPPRRGMAVVCPALLAELDEFTQGTGD